MQNELFLRRDRIQALSAPDLAAVAKTHLHPADQVSSHAQPGASLWSLTCICTRAGAATVPCLGAAPLTPQCTDCLLYLLHHCVCGKAAWQLAPRARQPGRCELAGPSATHCNTLMTPPADEQVLVISADAKTLAPALREKGFIVTVYQPGELD